MPTQSEALKDAYADAIWRAAAGKRANQPLSPDVSSDVIEKDYLPDAALGGGLFGAAKGLLSAGLLPAGEAVAAGAAARGATPNQGPASLFKTPFMDRLGSVKPSGGLIEPPASVEFVKSEPPGQAAPEPAAPPSGGHGHGRGLLVGGGAAAGAAGAVGIAHALPDLLHAGTHHALSIAANTLPDSVVNKITGEGAPPPIHEMSDAELDQAIARAQAGGKASKKPQAPFGPHAGR